MQSVIFVSSNAGTSEKGRRYDLVTLSDGLRAFTVNNPKQIDFSKYKEGDKLDIQFKLKGSWTGKGVDVEIVKVA